jgi:hypothetical protein
VVTQDSRAPGHLRSLREAGRSGAQALLDLQASLVLRGSMPEGGVAAPQEDVRAATVYKRRSCESARGKRWWGVAGGAQVGGEHGRADGGAVRYQLRFHSPSLPARALAGKFVNGQPTHILSLIRVGERRVDLLGKMERFRDQGELMCMIAVSLFQIGKQQEAVGWLERARKVGEAHGFFSVECQACLGLGKQAISMGRHEEGVELAAKRTGCSAA